MGEHWLYVCCSTVKKVIELSYVTLLNWPLLQLFLAGLANDILIFTELSCKHLTTQRNSHFILCSHFPVDDIEFSTAFLSRLPNENTWGVAWSWILLVGKCLVGKVSSWGNVWLGKSPVGELSMGNFPLGNRPVQELSSCGNVHKP